MNNKPTEASLVPKPPEWESWGWRERQRWKQKYIYQENATARRERECSEAYRDIARINKIHSVAKLKRKDWDRNRIEWFLRLVADKALVGFTIKAVERLATCVEACNMMAMVRPREISKMVRRKIEYEMGQIRKECVSHVKAVTPGRLEWDNGEEVEVLAKGLKGYKLIGSHRYERDGIRYRRIKMMVVEDDYLKFRAIMQLESTYFQDWLRVAMRRYVTRRFHRLAEVQGLVDKELGEEGDLDAVQKTENQRKEEVKPKQEEDGAGA